MFNLRIWALKSSLIWSESLFTFICWKQYIFLLLLNSTSFLLLQIYSCNLYNMCILIKYNIIYITTRSRAHTNSVSVYVNCKVFMIVSLFFLFGCLLMCLCTCVCKIENQNLPNLFFLINTLIPSNHFEHWQHRNLLRHHFLHKWRAQES